MTVEDRDERDAAARAEVVGRTIARVLVLDGAIEVHLGDVVLVGMTEPFGTIGCQGVGPLSLPLLVGAKVDHLDVERDTFVALDAGEHRLAFPIDASAATPRSVTLRRPARHESHGLPATWNW